jgi:hypothetical protein
MVNNMTQSRLYILFIFALFVASSTTEARKLPFAILERTKGAAAAAAAASLTTNGNGRSLIQTKMDNHVDLKIRKGSLNKHTYASLQLRGGGLGLSKTQGFWLGLFAVSLLTITITDLDSFLNHLAAFTVACFVVDLVVEGSRHRFEKASPNPATNQNTITRLLNLTRHSD